MSTYSAWYFVDAALYAGLAAGAAFRLLTRWLREGQCIPQAKQVVVFLIYVALLAYGACRGVITLLIGMNEVPHDQGLKESLVEMIPALFFCALQTLLIAKWVGHVTDISFVLHHQEFRWHWPLIWASLTLLFGDACVTVAALCDSGRSSRASLWVTITNIFTGVVYVLNGTVFIVLGVYLRSTWQPTTPHDVAACRRVLAIAVVFGGVCIVRGGALFALGSESTFVESSAQWGTPALIMLEAIALTTSLFGLTNQRGSTSVAAESTVEPMLHSYRSKFTGSASSTKIQSESTVELRGGGVQAEADDEFHRSPVVSSASLAANDAVE